MTDYCLCCLAPLDTATPYPQLCASCRATGTALAMRRISDDCAALSTKWGSMVSALGPMEQERFEKMLTAWDEASTSPAPYATYRTRINGFRKRLDATIAVGDAFADAVSTWWQHMQRVADRDVLRQHIAFTERNGQGDLGL